MSDLAQAIADLTPEQRAVLEARLRRKREEAPRRPIIAPRADRASHPLSFAQERLWFLDRLEPETSLYNVPAAFRLSGRLDVEALGRALDEVLRRHEVLRTRFDLDGDGKAVQIVLPERASGIPRIDLGSLAEADRLEESRQIWERWSRQPFDLSRGPLVRFGLLRLAETEHVLLLCFHHIVADGWSLGVWIKELGVLYEAFAAGRPSPLPELPIQYSDFAAWQRSWLQGAVLERQVSYWRESLSDLDGDLDLPSDRPHPLTPTYRGGDERVLLDRALVERLEDLGRRTGSTLFMTLLGSWQALLHRWSGRSRFAVGTPVAGRTRVETEGLIGLFVNTLALRAEVEGDPRFGTLLERVREGSLSAFEHQDLPFEKVVEALSPERAMSRSPLFQVMFVLQTAPRSELSVEGLRLSGVEFESTQAKFDLTLSLTPEASGVSGALEYSRDLFDRSTVARLVVSWLELLDAAVGDPDLRLSELPLLSDGQRHQLQVEWNGTPSPAGQPLCLHEPFTAQAGRTPEAEAVWFAGESLSYGELESRSNRLAHRLRAFGVGPEVRVGVCLERTPALVVSLLAVLKAGGAYVPLDPRYPQTRLELMLEDSGARLAMVEETTLERLSAWSGERLVVSGREMEEGPAHPVSSGVSPRNLAYLIYTSGSTGRPKGVAIEHASAWTLAMWARESFPSDCWSGVLASTSVCFDLSVFEIFVPLAWGGRLVLASDALELGSLAGAGVRLVNTVPSAMSELERLGALPASVRVVNLAGEPLKRGLAEALYARGVEQVWNLYGPSEDTTYSTASRVAAGDVGAPTIGRPLPGTRSYVVDRELEPVPLGASGELLLGGVGLARGYLGRPELTAERFVPDVWSGVAGGRLYRTGDRVRYRTDGELEFIGRLDQQVKVRGFRIELGEIESVLEELPEVQEAVVVVREEASGDRRLVAYVVGDASAADLRRTLLARLPEHMVPSAFVLLDALPLIPNGKVDRRSLPAPERSAEGESVAPRTVVEELLAGIWSSVLGVERVGREDHFFALGGHSLLAVQVVARVRQVLGVELGVRRLFESPTLEALAERIEEARGLSPDGQPPLERRSSGESFPPSFAQERLWFLEQLEPGSGAYNIPAALRLEGSLDVAALERALSSIVLRHESLRTVFRSESGQPVEHRLDAFPALWQIDLSPIAERESEALRLALEEAERPFDLSLGPLVRFGLLRLGEREHVLLLTLHHTVADGWSLGVWIKELGALYEAFAAGRPSPLAELPIQYSDFAAWQRSWLQGPVLERQVSYWRKSLSDLDGDLDLPSDRPRPLTPSYRGGGEPVSLDRALVERLEDLGRRTGSTLFMTLLGSWQALLHRWSGRSRFAIGTPVAGRTRVETEGLIGLFVNTLALRAEVEGDPRFGTLLERVREGSLSAFEHQDLPFEKVVEALSPERAMSRSPLFQAMFVLQTAPRPALSVSGLRLSGVDVESTRAKFDLTLSLAPEASGGAGVSGVLEYSRDLFDRSTVARLAASWLELLDAAVGDPDLRLSELPLLSDGQRHQLQVEWNGTPSPTGQPLCLHELFAAQAGRTPEAEAVWFAGESLSYGELEGRSNRLAHRLRASGVEPGVVVAVCVDRSFEMMVGLLAVLKAGGAYVPLDSEYPGDRLGFMLGDTEAPVLLTQTHLLGSFATFQGEALCLDDSGFVDSLASFPSTPPLGANRLDDLAYVIYTSGSTGRPKGVMVHHRGVVNRLLWAQESYPLTARDRVLQKASFSFDFSVWECFGPLAVGGVVVLARPGGHRDPAYLAQILRDERITMVHFVPSMLQVFLTEPDLGPFPDLRFVFCGGEALSPELQQEFHSRLGAVLRNQYGPTEASIDTTDWICRPNERRLVPLGRPLGNTRVHLVDRGSDLVPLGVLGEIAIGGVGVARGYLRRPDLTAERFVPDPFADRPGSRLYRTGDLARRLPDGNLEFRGRIDHQVKIRGFRIELGEIESALLADPSIAEAVAVAREESPGERKLVAYVVAPAGVEPGDLRDRLRQSLPDYMVPASVVVLDRLPLTPSGKLDRKALPAPVQDESRSGRIAPRTPAEEIVAGIWSDLLRVEGVGADDDFFELGGHSLLGSQVMARLREAFGVALPLRALFEEPTVAGLARRLAAERADESLPPLVRSPGGASPAPLSFPQERLWFLERLQPGTAAYHIPFGLRLRGPLSVPLLEAVLSEVQRRHEILRTTFPLAGDRAVQAVAPPSPRPLPLVDLRQLPDEAREAEVLRLLDEDAGRPFDLERGPLWRTQLLWRSEGDFVLLATLHHLISDGWSTTVMVDELAALYAAAAAGRPSPLPELGAQYGDFARWQRRILEGGGLDAQLDYWRAELAAAPPPLALPLDRPRHTVQTFRGGDRPVRLDPRLTAELRRLARRNGATPFMILLAAFDLLLHRISGQSDLTVGSPVANRARLETEGLIGCFMNMLVLRSVVSLRATFEELLQGVRRTSLDAYANQDLPFEKLVEALDPRRDLGRSPLFQVMLSFRRMRSGGPSLGGVRVEALASPSRTAKFELSLELAESEEEIAGRWEINTDLFETATAARLARGFEQLLKAVVEEPARRLEELPLMPEEERQQLLSEWSDTAAPVPAEPLHAGFVRWARREPERVALVQGTLRMGYGELERSANQLAQALATLGVVRGTIVGVCLRRSPSMVVALLGILKAGAAYLPLDPAYPAARLALMAEDAGAPVILAERSTADACPSASRVVLLPESGELLQRQPEVAPAVRIEPEDLAYVIYTSGSTGRPKGVMVTHGGVVNFFAGMDCRLGGEAPGTWLAATSISFDISVLELLWTLSRGFRVVIASDQAARPAAGLPRAARRPLDFSLFYFASGGGDERPGDRYRLLLEGARFADRRGFAAVWTPERHFHEFGGLFPNPSVLGGALAALTERIAIRAGSVVLPLHNPIRVAEEWSVVDNLSRGRAGVSFASGWHPDDFALAPENYLRRKELMFEGIETVRRLWRGEAVQVRGGGGNEIPVKIHPRPIQAELPVWITAAGNEETFRAAGEVGAGLLTHLLGQSLGELAEKIAAYRRAWTPRAGGPAEGHVTLMLHTFVHPDLDYVREAVRGPFTRYLESSLGLVRNLAASLGRSEDSSSWTEEDRAAILDHAFQRYFETSSLFGTPDMCQAMAERLREIGVDEAACLIDFGVEVEPTLAALEHLDVVRRRLQPDAPADEAEPDSVPALIARHGVTHFQGTPSLLRMLAADPSAFDSLRPLRRLMVGGEAFPADLARRAAAEVAGEVHNMYGPTETTIWSATQRIGGSDVTLGAPIVNTSIVLVDGDGALVPTGSPGELRIGGAGLARGYLDRPELTAERFVPDPWSASAGARQYRTGDLARRRSDGRLEFLGRVDHQVKVRGFRIELQEIEAALRRHPALLEAVVLAREEHGDHRLVGYLVPREGAAPPAPAEVRAFLAQSLPEPMVPALYVALKAMPLTPNGKVDRQALPAPAEAGTVSQGHLYVAPRSPVEEMVAGLWSQLLGAERVGIHDNFFHLGGHSLLATQLSARLNEAFGIELPLRTLFEAPTLAALATQIEAARGLRPAGPALVRVERRDVHPLSLAQQRLWYLDQLQPGNAAYNDHGTVRLVGPLDLPALERSLGEIVRRHETLRTTFGLRDARPVQRIAPYRELGLPLVDLAALPAPQGDLALRELVRGEARRPFELAVGPLIRVTLLRTSELEHVLLLVIHHIIWDGWSMVVFSRELVALYEAFARREPSPLPELAVQYVDFAEWERAWLEGDPLAEHLSYWSGQLGGRPPLVALPTDHPRPALQLFRGRRLPFGLPADLSAAVRSLSRREGVTLFMSLLAGFACLLHGYSGETDLVVGTDVAHRSHRATESMIGFFVNQLVLRTDLSGDPSFTEVQARVRATSISAYAHQDLPFDKLVAALQGERDRGRAPLFQVKFVLQNAPSSGAGFSGLSLLPLEIDRGTSKFDLLFNVIDGEDGIAGSVEFDTDLFEVSTIERLIGRWEDLLRAATLRPEAKLSELAGHLAQEERQARAARQRERSEVLLRGRRRRAVDFAAAQEGVRES